MSVRLLAYTGQNDGVETYTIFIKHRTAIKQVKNKRGHHVRSINNFLL